MLILAGCGGTGAGSQAANPLSGSAPLNDQVVVAVDSSIASPSRPVVWFIDAKDDHMLVAYDWTGRATGSMHVTASEPFGTDQSPDGTALVLLHAKPTSGGRVVGPIIGNVSWAGDSRHLCVFLTDTGTVYVPSMTPATPPAPTNELIGHGAQGALYVDDPAAGTSRRVESFGTFGDHGDPAVLACNAVTDRAIVGETFVGETSQVHALRLSAGRVVSSSGCPSLALPLAGIVASADASLVASNPMGTTVSNDWQVCDVNDGARLGTVPGIVLTFTSDDNLVVTQGYVDSTDTRFVYRLVDWRTGRIVWSATLASSTVITRPGSNDVLLEPWEYRTIAGRQSREAFTTPIVVHADGRSTKSSTEVRPLG
ncbi:MAG TPA: hypothetical protein VIG86_12430 [Candidatus Dormibacteraeota bacterium]